MVDQIFNFKKVGIDLQIDNTCKIKIQNSIEIGNHVAIDFGVYCSTSMIIGDYVHIAPYVCIIGGKDALLKMGNFSGISAGSKIICASDDFVNGMLNPQVPIEYRNVINKPIIFEDFSCVGVNCVVMPGVTLAEGSVIGSGSVLTKSTEPWTIYVGSPAKAVSTRNKISIIENAKKLGY